MEKIFEIAKWLKSKNIDSAFISSPANVYYLTGFNCNPHERLLGLFIFQNEEPLMIVPKLDAEDAKKSGWQYEIVPIDDTDDAWRLVEKVVKKRFTSVKSVAVEKDHLIFSRIDGLNRALGHPEYLDIVEIIQQLRIIKSQSELAVIREAARLADFAVEIGAEEIAEGRTEMEVLAALEYRLKKQGARMAFETMVLTGKNAASPHGVPGNTQIKRGDLVLFDLGVVIDHYCSDISRTLALGQINEEQQKIYDIVLQGQLAALEAITPGKTCAEIDLTARKIISDAGYGEYFPHRLGHGLGIDVHEAPEITSVNQQIVQEGMVFTVEPGIYLPDVAGVRIEDDVYVTANGVEVLTKYPKNLINL